VVMIVAVLMDTIFRLAFLKNTFLVTRVLMSATVVRGNKLVRALPALNAHVLLPTCQMGANLVLPTLLTPKMLRRIPEHVEVEKNHHAGLVFIRRRSRMARGPWDLRQLLRSVASTTKWEIIVVVTRLPVSVLL
jgi:hypothetical protein